MGGDTESELASTEQQLTRSVMMMIIVLIMMMIRSVLRLMVCPAMEEDAGEGGEGEEKYDFNVEYIENIGAMMVNMEATRSGPSVILLKCHFFLFRPCLQFKITAMAPADLGRDIESFFPSNMFSSHFKSDYTFSDQNIRTSE